MKPQSDNPLPELVFLVGPPRSGTTWLQTMLGNHPVIGTSQESHLFNHFLTHMIRSWDHLKGFDDGRGGIGLPAYQTEAQFIQMMRDIVFEVLGNADEFHENPVFLEKTPDHILNMQEILRVLPGAKFIYMIRRPEDTIESMLCASQSWGRDWAPDNILKAISTYRYFAKKGTTDLQNINASQVVKVKYEDLVADTSKELTRILDFLGLDASDRTVSHMINAKSALKKYGDSASKSGNQVVEPAGFARAVKGRLNWVQKLLVRLFLGRYTHQYGY